MNYDEDISRTWAWSWIEIEDSDIVEGPHSLLIDTCNMCFVSTPTEYKCWKF